MRIFCRFFIVLLATSVIRAEDISVRKSSTFKTDIDISKFEFGSSFAQNMFKETLLRDLKRWGWFRLRVNSPICLEGSCQIQKGRLSIRVKVHNKLDRTSYMELSDSEEITKAKLLSHSLADDMVRSITGHRGIASTRIVMVGEVSGRRDLFVCDVDGQGLLKITQDGTPCLSPKWNSDASRIYYMSFYKGFPDVYVIDMMNFRRQEVSGQPGVNAGPAISPDGKQMALTLSRDGNPELYVMSLKSRKLKRLTRTSHAAEASPCWSPEGKKIVYVSDQSGTPQLYIISRESGSIKPLTGHRWRENVSPDWGQNGKIVYSSRREGYYQIVMIDLKTGIETQLTQDRYDHEDPSWAPDRRHVVYVKSVEYSLGLYILDSFGDPEIRLTTFTGDFYSPSWSPR